MADYDTHEAMERLHEHHDPGHPLLRYVPVIAAVLAICAGLSSLLSARLGEDALGLENEALLAEVKASDTWAEYQADSIKAHLYEIQSIANKAAPAVIASAKKYRDEQKPLRVSAQAQEEERDRAMASSQRSEERKADIDVGLALFEIGIVLTSIAAMIKRSALMLLGAAGGIAGLFAASLAMLVRG